MNIGDTFLWQPPNLPEYLFIIITPPESEGRCVIVRLSETVRAQPLLIVEAGQHPKIRANSAVDFGDAFETTIQKIQKEIQQRRASAQAPLNPTILQKIIEAAATHSAFPRHLRKSLPQTKPIS